jgi:hypothetical protein
MQRDANLIGTLLWTMALLLVPSPAAAQQFTEIAPGLPNYPRTCVAWGDYDGDGEFTVPLPAAPTLLSVQRDTDGFRLEASGTPGWGYGILATNSLPASSSGWTRLGTGMADSSGHIVFTDTDTNLPQRFYRSVFP